MSRPDRFKPKSLSKGSLEAPMQRHWDVMGADEADRLHQRALAEHDRFDRFGPRTRKRFLTVAFGTMAAFAVLATLLFFSIYFVVPFAIAGFLIGAVVVFLRPYDFLCGTLYAAASFGASLWSRIPGLLALLVGVVFFGVGIVAGRVEEGKVIDGE